MIEHIYLAPGYKSCAPDTITRLGIPRLRNFQAEIRERMLCDAYTALKYGGFLFVVGDAEWHSQPVIDEVQEFGFKFQHTFDHKEFYGYEADYKVQCWLFQKPFPKSPRDYIFPLFTMEPGWKVLDVGPGNFPLARADFYLEIPVRRDMKEYSEDLLPPLEKIIWGDVEGDLSHIPDKHFDFIWASHVFEHLEDPERAARNLSRIGKRGVMIVPSYIKESMFLWEEQDHKWDIMPPQRHGGPARFVQPNMEVRRLLRDAATQSSLCRLFRTGPPSTHDHRTLSAWYRTHEHLLDVCVPWEDVLKVDIIK